MTASPPAADALHRTVEAITEARRTLVTGLVAADAAAALAAFDLAEAAGAAVDPGSPETARVLGPLLARIGGVTAAPEELRDRADLVLLWFCDPERQAPRFSKRFVDPPLDGQTRQTIAIGPTDGRAPGPHHRHERVAADATVDLARLVEALIRAVAVDEAACDPAPLAAARQVAAAIAAINPLPATLLADQQAQIACPGNEPLRLARLAHHGRCAVIVDINRIDRHRGFEPCARLGHELIPDLARGRTPWWRADHDQRYGRPGTTTVHLGIKARYLFG